MQTRARDQNLSAGTDAGVPALLPRDRVARIAGFGLAYFFLVYFGYGLREQQGALVILWPAAGFMLVSLFITPYRAWPGLVALQICIELLVDYLRSDPVSLTWSAAFAAADSVDALVGAIVARRLIPQATLPRIRQVLFFFAASCLGAAASACIGAFAAMHTLIDVSYPHEWQLWWAGNWLGSLAIAPMALCWGVRWKLSELSVALTRGRELAFTTGVLLAMTVWIFTSPAAGIASFLQMPALLLAILVFVAFRFPPRWSTTLAALTVVCVAYLSSQGLGPFSGDTNPFVRLGSLQLYLATLVVFTFMLGTVLLERHRTLEELTLSEERYRSFVAHSNEAVWRIEVRPPMPIDLAPQEQLAWLKEHAQVAECNGSYRRMEEACSSHRMSVGTFPANVPWSAIYLEHLEAAARKGYSLEGLPFSLVRDGRSEAYLANFSGMVEQDRLTRIWGVASNVTQLTELAHRLKREQERMKAYARQLVVAQEQARRTIATSLRDGIEKQLAEISTTFNDVLAQAPAGSRPLLQRLRSVFGEVLDYTRELSAEVSPPSLHDVGLGAALQWLVIYMRQHAGLNIELQISVQERDIKTDLRIAAYQVIHELLRNVVQHAGVQAARVIVAQSGGDLTIEVSDNGRGFNYQLDLFVDAPRGFGLFGVVDRVRSVHGELTLDTAPGKGCRVFVRIPLDPPEIPI